jgi:hypothetical protein
MKALGIRVVTQHYPGRNDLKSARLNRRESPVYGLSLNNNFIQIG